MYCCIPTQYDQGIKDYLKYYRGLHAMCPAPFDGIIEVFDYARDRNVRLALVTGKGEHSTEITLDIFDIRSYFDAIETGSPTGPRKVQGIKNVLKQLGVTPGETLYVGDSPSDVKASREAGVAIVSAAWAETADGEQLRPLQTDKLCATVQEFKRHIEEFAKGN